MKMILLYAINTHNSRQEQR